MFIIKNNFANYTFCTYYEICINYSLERKGKEMKSAAACMGMRSLFATYFKYYASIGVFSFVL